ncbi:MKS1 protein [Nymphaea thermarum]|nr:MKS1 protein [Nymphaea thermarum]
MFITISSSSTSLETIANCVISSTSVISSKCINVTPFSDTLELLIISGLSIPMFSVGFMIQNESEFQAGKSPAGKEPQGLRPTPVKVGKDLHRSKKAAAARRRDPVIVYAVSPEVIHVSPSEFMPLVQRLTGHSPTSSSPEENRSPTSDMTVSRQGLSSRTKNEDGSTNPVTDRAAAAFDLTMSPILSSPPPISPAMFLPSPLSRFGGFIDEQKPSLSGNNRDSNSSSVALLKEDSHGGGDLWLRRRF